MANRELHTWKEIADYLDVTPRTAQKWEKERGLPVRRLPGERGGIYSMAEELDAWRLSGKKNGLPDVAGPQTQVSAAPPRWTTTIRRPWILISIPLILALAFGYWVWFRPGKPASWRIVGKSFIISDNRGHDLWAWSSDVTLGMSQTHEFNERMSRFIWIGDVDGDGKIETLVAPNPNDFMRTKNSTPLVCLDESGNERWRFTPGGKLASGRDQFLNLYFVANFLVTRMAPNRQNVILVSSVNIPDYPCEISLLDIHTGKAIREYRHSGYLGTNIKNMLVSDLNGDGISEIYLGGVNNAEGKATLVVLNPDDFAGFSRESQWDYQLQGSPPGREIRRVMFPNIYQDANVDGINGVMELGANPQGLWARVLQYHDSSHNVFNDYFFATDGRLLRMDPSSEFISFHKEEEHAGLLKHSFTSEELYAIEKAVVVLAPSYQIPPPKPIADPAPVRVK
jgi:hypothetical protein